MSRLARRIACSIYRGLMTLAPRAVRITYAADMATTFAALFDAAAAQGWRAVLALFAGETVDLWKARRRSRPALTRRRTPMTSPLQLAENSMQFRSALRSLGRRPTFALAALMTLTLGTSATVTVFTVVASALIKPLPYPDADRLVMLYEASAEDRTRTTLIAPAKLVDWNQMNRTFEAVSGFYGESVTDTSGSDPERLNGRRVAPAFFTVYGVQPLLGRTFSEEEERFQGSGAAVLTEAFWQRRFARDSRALGRSLVIGNRPFTIVGVMPASFAAGNIDVWLPAQTSPGLLRARQARFYNGIGRLKASVSVTEARDDLDRVQRELGARFPQSDQAWTSSVVDLKDFRVGDQRRRLWFAFAAVMLLWLIAITNVSGLVLVETHRRARELAVRTALGASRARTVLVVLHDVIVLSAISVVLSTVLSYWAIDYVRATFVMLPRVSELALDWRAIVFAAATTTVATLACGIIPALGVTRRPLLQSMTRGGRGTTGVLHRPQRALVVAQVSLSVLLCAASALLARSYHNLTRVDLGLSADDVVTFHVAARWDEDRKRLGQMQQEIVDGLLNQPGVEAAGLTSFLPAASAPWRHAVTIDGATTGAIGGVTAGQRIISTGYLQALRVPLLAGNWCRAFGSDAGAPRTALINRRLAEAFGSAPDLIGKRIRFSELPGAWDFTIAGVIGDVAEDGPSVAPSPYLYACAQPGDWPDPEYVVRANDAGAVISSLRALVRGIDSGRAVFSVRRVSDVLSAAVDQPRLSTGLVTAFAAVALLLAATGLYGLFALVVSETRREMSVRLALGATPQHLFRLVCAGAGRLLLVGIAFGFVLTVGASRWLRSQLFGIEPLDPLTLVAATIVLLLVSAIAVGIPALKAARVVPSEALAGE
jgi:putative ABC transport system permease protein